MRELRQYLSVYLRRVAEGESLEVTDRGQPVALLGPLPPADDPLARLQAMGLLERRASTDHRALPAAVVVPKGASLTDVLLADRDT